MTTTIVTDIVFGMLWQLVSLFVIVTSWKAARQLFPRSEGATRILHVSVIAIAICIFAMTVVGAAGLLFKSSILIAAGTISLMVYLKGWTRASPNITYSEQSHGPIERSPAINVVWIAMLSLLAGHVFRNGLLRYPSDWDTLMYHLPFIDHWLQSQSLAATESARWSTPAQSELLGVWFTGPFTGDFLIALNNVPIIIVWATAVIEFSRQLGCRGWWPHLTSIACLLVHVSIRQTVDASNDLMVVAFFTSSLAYAIRYHRSSSRPDLMLFGISIGMLASVKYFAVGYAAVAGAVFLLLNFSAGARRLVAATAYATLLAALVGGYWYARNWVMTGYPLYPMGSSDMGERIPYPGGLANTTLAFNGNPDVPGLAFSALWRLGGPIYTVAVMVAPLLICWLAINAWRHGSQRIISLALIASVLGSASVLLVTPMLVEDQPETLNHLKWGYTPLRYALCFLSLCVIALMRALEKLSSRLQRRGAGVVLAMVGGAIVAQLMYSLWRIHRFDMPTSCLIGANLGSGVWFLQLVLQRVSKRLRCAALLIVVAGLIGFLSHRWHTGLADHFNRYHQATSFSVICDNPKRILVLDERSYPYFGSRRQNFVTQPMLFYGIEDVRERVASYGLDHVIARYEGTKIISRYRPAWDALDADPDFRLVEDPGTNLRVYVVQLLELPLDRK